MGDKARSEALADGKWRRELERGGKVDAMDGDDMWYEAVVIGTTRFIGAARSTLMICATSTKARFGQQS